MEHVYLTCSITLLFGLCFPVCSTQNVGLIKVSQCACFGYNVIYECTTMGAGSTVWVLDNTQECEIQLRHSRFASDTVTGSCMNGAVEGRSIKVENGFYTSQLSVLASTNVNGKIIRCDYDDGDSPVVIGMSTLTFSTQQDSFPPPNIVGVQVSREEIVISWNPVPLLCPALDYNVVNMNCGTCITNTSSTRTVCSNFTVSNSNNICEFNVQSVICGSFQGNFTSSLINLKVPSAPFIHVFPHYSYGRLPLLTDLTTTFDVLNSFDIYDGIDGSAMTYTIITSDSSFDSTCSSAKIPASACTDGTCSHIYNATNSSCPPYTGITVTVFASNILGDGPLSNSLTRGGINTFADINYDSLKQTIICNFMNQPPENLKHCNASIASGIDCKTQHGDYHRTGTGEILSTPPIAIDGLTEFCFSVNASSGNVIVIVEGTLAVDTSQNDSINTSAAIAVPLILAVVVIIIVILLGVATYILLTRKQNILIIKFSVKNTPGALANALVVFEGRRVNILGVNTHLHSAEFDRVSRPGYKDNFVYCFCSQKDKVSLTNALTYPEFIGGDRDADEPTTIKFSIKDKPGALRKALETIGNFGINMIGLNTRRDRESTPGYRDNYVKCKCSERTERKVVCGLEKIGAINITVERVIPQESNGKKGEFLLKDNDGNITELLQVFSECGINLDVVNPSYIKFDHDVKGQFRYNYVECYCSKDRRGDLCRTLRTPKFGAQEAIELSLDQAKPNNPVDHPDYCIIKIGVLNEAGSLVRALLAFKSLEVDIIGVNTLHCTEDRNCSVTYRHVQVEYAFTNNQENELRRKLKATGIVIEIQQTKDCSSSTSSDQDEFETKLIQYWIKDEVGALACTLAAFQELNINIINQHMENDRKSVVYKRNHVTFKCTNDEEARLMKELKATGLVVDIKCEQWSMTDTNESHMINEETKV